MNAPTTITPAPDYNVANSTDALSLVLSARRTQVEQYGHTPAADDAAGPHELIRRASARLRQAESQMQMASDMTMGDVRRLDPRSRAALIQRTTTATALLLAALETILRAIDGTGLDK